MRYVGQMLFLCAISSGIVVLTVLANGQATPPMESHRADAASGPAGIEPHPDGERWAAQLYEGEWSYDNGHLELDITGDSRYMRPAHIIVYRSTQDTKFRWFNVRQNEWKSAVGRTCWRTRTSIPGMIITDADGAPVLRVPLNRVGRVVAIAPSRRCVVREAP